MSGRALRATHGCVAQVITFGVGGTVLFFGLVVLLLLAKDLLAVLRLRRAPTPIAQLHQGGEGHIRGRVFPAEQGVLRSPFTGRDAVILRVSIYASPAGHQRGIERLDNHAGDVDFLVDDGSGRCLRVRPNGALLLFESKALFDGRGFDDATPAPDMAAHIAARLDSQDQRRLGNRLRVEERILAPGEEVIAIGRVAAYPDPTCGSIPFMSCPAPGVLQLGAPGQRGSGKVVLQVIVFVMVSLVGLGAVIVSCSL